jgi:hypothetical protein
VSLRPAGGVQGGAKLINRAVELARLEKLYGGDRYGQVPGCVVSTADPATCALADIPSSPSGPWFMRLKGFRPAVFNLKGFRTQIGYSFDVALYEVSRPSGRYRLDLVKGSKSASVLRTVGGFTSHRIVYLSPIPLQQDKAYAVAFYCSSAGVPGRQMPVATVFDATITLCGPGIFR